MRVLRLQDIETGPTLDFHPYVTIVSGLPSPAREQVVAALTALSGGTEPGMSGLVEAHGVVLDLDTRNLELLDLVEHDLDVLIRASDLDEIEAEPLPVGAAPMGDPAPPDAVLAPARQAVRDARSAYEVLCESLDALRQLYRDAGSRHADLLAELTVARQERTTPTVGTEHTAEGADGTAATDPEPSTLIAVLEPGAVSAEAEAELAAAAARVDRLRSARDEIAAALEPLDDIDVAAVQGALAQASAGSAVERVPDPEAISLADELGAAEAAVEAWDRRMEAEGRGPEAARRRLDEAQARLRGLESAQRPRTIEPADVAELEAAHATVQAAEQKVVATRLSGKSLRKKLDELVAAEEEVLNRMGFRTYTEFVMSTTSPTVNLEAKAQVEAAQVELVEAEAAYAQLAAQWDGDPERIALVNGVVAIRQAAADLIGSTEDRDVQHALRSMTVVPEGVAEATTASIGGLRSALADVGVDFGDLDLSEDDVIDVATVWLADMAEAAQRRDHLAGRLATAEGDVHAAEGELATLETSAHRVAPSVHEDFPAEPEPTDVADASEPLEAPGADSFLADLERQVEEARQTEEELAEKVDSQESLLAAAAEVAAAAEKRLAAAEASEPAPAPTGTMGEFEDPVEGTGVERSEWYLLARLASQRSVSYAGSVPLVIDDALAGFGDDDVKHLLGRLERMADAVQVIYLSDDPRVCDWAEIAGLDRAAVVEPY